MVVRACRMAIELSATWRSEQAGISMAIVKDYQSLICLMQ